MRLEAAPLLERHRIFHSRNVEEAHAFADRMEYRFEFGPRPPPEIDLRINGVAARAIAIEQP